MRKTSYVLTFFAVSLTLLLNILSALRTDWLTVHSEIFNSKSTVYYGLMQRCEHSVVRMPGLPDGSKVEYTDYKCRPFPTPVSDKCNEENKMFCVGWITAGYLTELSMGFAGVASLAIIFGVTTHSRRRRIWSAVAVLIAIHTALQIATFSIVTDLYTKDLYPTFEYARPGIAYVLNTLSWVFGTLITIGVVITGVSANKGHRWAAGNRGYQAIEG